MTTENCNDPLTEKQKKECNLRNQIRINAPKIVWVPDAAFYYSADQGKTQAGTLGLMSAEQVGAGKATIKQACDKLLDVSAATAQGRKYLGFRPMEDDSGEFYYVEKANWGKVAGFSNFYIAPDSNSIGFYLLSNIPNREFNKKINMKENMLKFSLVNQ
jgi:hypothetical protein